jgi:hypothetical protein
MAESDKITGIHLDEARQAGAMTLRTTDTLSQEFDVLKACLAENYGCWGEDEAGKSLEKQYVPNAQEFQDNVGSSMTDLHTTAADVNKIPDEFESADQDNAGSVDRTG